MKKISPIGNRILIKYISQNETTKSGILLPESKTKGKKTEGIVEEIAPDAKEYCDRQELKKGDKVFIPKIYGEEYKIGEDHFVIIDVKEILAILG